MTRFYQACSRTASVREGVTCRARFQSLPAAAHRGVHAAVALGVALRPELRQLRLVQPRRPRALLSRVRPLYVGVVRRPLALHVVVSSKRRGTAAAAGLARGQLERRQLHCRTVGRELVQILSFDFCRDVRQRRLCTNSMCEVKLRRAICVSVVRRAKIYSLTPCASSASAD